jgi:electron transport complex protein RnfE
MEKTEKFREELLNWDNTVRKRKITLSNPVFVKGLALAPVAIAATTVKNSLILSLAVLLLLTPTRIITSVITRRMSVPLKTFFYPLVSAVVFGGAYYAMYRMLGTTAFSLGVYLPILVVDPLIVKNFEKTRKESFKYSIINGLRNTGGFVVACMLLGAVREILAFGTFAGIQITSVKFLPMAQHSFGGFLIIGLIAAVWKNFVNIYKDSLEKEAAAYESGIR